MTVTEEYIFSEEIGQSLLPDGDMDFSGSLSRDLDGAETAVAGVAELNAQLFLGVDLYAMESSGMLDFYQSLSEFEEVVDSKDDAVGVSFNPWVVKQHLGDEVWNAFSFRMKAELTVEYPRFEILNYVTVGEYMVQVQFAGARFVFHKKSNRHEWYALAVCLLIARYRSKDLSDMTGIFFSDTAVLGSAYPDTDNVKLAYDLWKSMPHRYLVQSVKVEWWMIPFTASLLPVCTPVRNSQFRSLDVFGDDTGIVTLRTTIYRLSAVMKYTIEFGKFFSLRTLKGNTAWFKFGFGYEEYFQQLMVDKYDSKNIHFPSLGKFERKLLHCLERIVGRELTVPTQALRVAVASKTLLRLNAEERRLSFMATESGRALFHAHIAERLMGMEMVDKVTYTNVIQHTFSKSNIAKRFPEHAMFECVEFQDNVNPRVGDICVDAFYAIFHLTIYMAFEDARTIAREMLSGFSDGVY